MAGQRPRQAKANFMRKMEEIFKKKSATVDIVSGQHSDQERTLRKRVRDTENSPPKQRKTAVLEEPSINTQRQTEEVDGQTEKYRKKKETKRKVVTEKAMPKNGGNYPEKHLLAWQNFDELKLIMSNICHHNTKKHNAYY